MTRRGRLPREVELARDRAVREHLDARRRPPTQGELARWAAARFEIGPDAARSLARRHLAAWQAMPLGDRLAIARAAATVGVLAEEAHG